MTTNTASSIFETTPPGTQAAMIHSVLNAAHPKLALPTIAANYSVTLAQLQAVLGRHGYPDQSRMRAAAAHLANEAAQAIDPRPDAGTSGTTEIGLRRLPVTKVHPDPDNLREHVNGMPSRDGTKSSNRDAPIDDIEQLADSIRETGLLQPIVVRQVPNADHYIVVAGHRRLAAIQRLRWTHVDVVIRPPMRPDDVVAAMLIENGQRRDLDPIEEARGIRKLKAVHDLTDADLARKIGRSQSYVSFRLALLNLTPEEQDQVRNGDMGTTAGAHLGRLNAGKTRKSSKGHITVAHFGPTNELSHRAKNRCERLSHRALIAGGIACGSCWESVIRADERDRLQEANAKADDCVTCGTPLEKAK